MLGAVVNDTHCQLMGSGVPPLHSPPSAGAPNYYPRSSDAIRWKRSPSDRIWGNKIHVMALGM